MKSWNVPFVRLGAMLAAGALVLAACSGGATTTPSSAPSPAETSAAPSATPSATPSAAPTAGAAGGPTVKIIDFGFDPASMTVKVGASITWTNTGSATHTVTADDASFDSGDLGSGATFSQAFAKAGTFTYHCKIHASMKATVVVTP